MNTLTLQGFVSKNPNCPSLDADAQSLALRFTLVYCNLGSADDPIGPRNYLPCHLSIASSELPIILPLLAPGSRISVQGHLAIYSEADQPLFLVDSIRRLT